MRTPPTHLIWSIVAGGIALALAWDFGVLYQVLVPLTIVSLILIPPMWNKAEVWQKVVIIVLILSVCYVLLPTAYLVKFVDSQGASIEGMITAKGPIITSSTGNYTVLFVPKGQYTATFHAPYRINVTETVPYWRWSPIELRRVVLYPDSFTFKTRFVEPYERALSPRISVKGTTIDDVPYAKEGTRQTEFAYGEYTVQAATEYFNATFDVSPDSIPTQVNLSLNDNALQLTIKEAKQIKAFVADYVDLAARRIIDGGFPKQYHLYKKNQTLSLGDMLFVLCQLRQPEQPVLFVPKATTYQQEGSEECYRSLLESNVPKTINNTRAEQAIYEQLSDVVRTVPFDFGELNQKRHVLDWALSYDVEYGRYVPESGLSESTYTTCQVAPEYRKAMCDDPDLAGWVSQSTGTWWFDEYEYPVSSGMIGWRYILSLSERYGVPTTQYMVSKDIELFKDKDLRVFEFSKNLADQGFIEVGGHTRYHTHLGKVPKKVAREELRLAREELEALYNTTVTGARNPYLTLVDNSTRETEQALADFGYTYYSHYGNYSKRSYNTTTITHKPINFFGYVAYATPGHLDAALQQLDYVVSLDHPWNIQFHETDPPIRLEEAPKQPVQKRALILEAMSRGAHFTTVEEVEVS